MRKLEPNGNLSILSFSEQALAYVVDAQIISDQFLKMFSLMLTLIKKVCKFFVTLIRLPYTQFVCIRQ